MGFSAGVGFLVDTDGNGTTDGKAVTLKKGTGTTLTLSGSVLTIAAAGGSGSGSMTTVQSAGSQVGGADIVTLNFGSEFGITETSDTLIAVTIDDATTSAKGKASFSSDNFSVSSGAVTIKSGGVDLTDEVTGTLPVANGGTGATALTNLIALTTHTTGNYVASVASGTGLSGGASGSEGATLTLALDLKDEDNMASNSASHAASQQSIKAYVDSVASGLDVKDSVRIATTANITLANQQTIDGVSVVAGNRVLVKDQSTGSQNGIYLCVDGGSWTRSTDMAAGTGAAGVFIFVEEGTANADNGYVCTTNDDADTVGTHSLAFSQFSGAGQITAGTNLTKSGNTLNVDDAFLKNDASDTTTGTITAAGFTTTGTWTIDTSAGGTTGITSINITDSFTDDDVTIMSAGAIKEKIEDYGYTTNVGDITGVTAGVGLSGGGATGGVTLTLDLSELSDVTPVNGDKLATLDSDGSTEQLTTVADLATLFAGSNLTATNSVIAVDDAFIVNNAADIMAVSDFGANAALKIDANQPATAGAEDSVGLWIDYDRIVAGSGTAAHNDIGIDLDVNAASLGTSTVKGIDIDVVGATTGTHTATGIDVTVGSADHNYGIKVTGGSIQLGTLASAPDDVSTYGQLWVKDNGSGAANTELYFTDDAGNDIQLTDNGSTAGGGGSARSVSGDTDDGVITWKTSDDTFIVESKMKFNGSGLLLGEVAAAASDEAGYGQVWVKNDTPTSLWFTTDAGNDIQLTSGTGVVAASAVLAYDGTIGTKLQPSGTINSAITEFSLSQDEDLASSASAANDGTNTNVSRVGVGFRANVTVVHPDADTAIDTYTVDANDHHIIYMAVQPSDTAARGADPANVQNIQLPAAANYIGREIKITWSGASFATGVGSSVFVKPHGDDAIVYGPLMWDAAVSPGGSDLATAGSSGGSHGLVMGARAFIDPNWIALGVLYCQHITVVAVDAATFNGPGSSADSIRIRTPDGQLASGETGDTCRAAIWVVTDAVTHGSPVARAGFGELAAALGCPTILLPMSE